MRRLGGTIGDVAVGGGGRFLLVALKEARKLAVFDVNAADVVKTIPLASTNVLSAAGANKLLIAFPEEQVLERWDLGTLEREGGSHISPIDGWIRALAMGSDSDGPALVLWYPRARGYPAYLKASNYFFGEPGARFSFIDLDRLSVLKAGSIEFGKSSPIKESDSLSTSGGSFVLQPELGNRRGYKVYLRASAGSDLFEISVLPMQLLFLKRKVGGSGCSIPAERSSPAKRSAPTAASAAPSMKQSPAGSPDRSSSARPTLLTTSASAGCRGMSRGQKEPSGTSTGPHCRAGK